MDKISYKRIIGALAGSLGLLATLAVACGLLLVGPTLVSAQADVDRTVVNQDLTIEKGDMVKGDVSVTNGNLTMLGEVRSDVVVFHGNAKIEGTVHGDVAVTGGDVELGPKSVVEGNVLALGGKVVRDPGAKVVGRVNAPS